MRCLSANYLEAHKDYFEPFCQIGYKEIIKDVLTMGKEAEGIGIGPLQLVLKVKIQIVTIDKNQTEVINFEQMKISGKCPLIYILFKPGHYDIIYSRNQSNIDCFNEQREDFSGIQQLPQDYKIENPDLPFFVEITKSGQECPQSEFQQFLIQFDFPYLSTEQTSQLKQKEIEAKQSVVVQLQQCGVCQIEFDQQDCVYLECHHIICKYCLEDKINLQTGGKIISKSQGAKKASCSLCNHILTLEEIEKVVGEERLKKALNQ